MTTIQLTCDTCGADFDKPRNEYNRRVRQAVTKFYCCISCSKKTKKNIEMITEAGKDNHFDGTIQHTQLITEKDKVRSVIKEFNRRVRRRKHYVEDLDEDTLYNIWKEQDGRCAYTGVKLVHMRDPKYKDTSNNYKISLDRIDSSKPYTNHNAQFISLSANQLKSDMSEKEVQEFFDIIKNNT